MEVNGKGMLRRVVLASLVGATIEWYDFFLYGVVAGIVLNKLYFPSSDPLISTLLAYTTFAAGFLTRPLGGVIFGHFGDRIGRKPLLILTLLIMGVATTLIALVPTYAQIGISAPIILCLLRMFQGIGLGGEWGGAVLMCYEYAPPEKRGLYASLPQIGLSIGLCLASGVVGLMSYLLTDQQFLAWGWRIAFGVSFVLVVVGFWIRMRVMETPEFLKVKKEGAQSKVPFVDMWRDFKWDVIAGMGARYIDGVFFTMYAVVSIGYLTNTVKIDRTIALTGVMLASLIMCSFIPLFGHLSDRLGRTRVYALGSLVTAFSILPSFWLMNHSGGSTALVWIAIIIPFGIFWASIYGPEAALFSDLFDAKVRYTGISFVYQFAGILAGGMTPIIATSLQKYAGGQMTFVYGYVIIVGIISALSAVWIGKRKQAAAVVRAAGVAIAK
jgi:MHS family shikimate/dehydroshikimate transporter-like MFS transporter